MNVRPLRPRWPALAWLVPPVLAGALLRLWNAGAQVLGGDEVHAVRVALAEPLGEILTTYQLRDNCIPLTALYHLLLARDIALDEWLVQLPILLAGLLALAAVPLAAARRLDRETALPLAWLVALSPLLVLYSRIARPYMPIVLLSFGAAVAFEAWWRTGRRGPGAAYVLLAALAVWFHLASAPFVLAPFAFALGSLALDRRRQGPGLRPLLLLGAVTAAALALFLLPARESLLALVAEKREPQRLSGAALWAILRLQAGTARPAVAAAFWAVAALGLGRLLRRDPRLALYTLALAAVQVAGLVILAPEMMGHPLVFDRYLLPVLPWVLLWVAAGLAAPWGPAGGRPALAAQRAAALALVGGLFLAGPLAERAYRESSFTHHNDFVAFFCPRGRLAPGAVPRFYRSVLPGAAGPVIEAPWLPFWSYTRAYYLYQEVHGQEVLLGSAGPPRQSWRLAFANTLALRPEAFLTSRARWLVVHSDLVAEERRVDGHCWPLIPEMKPSHARQLRRAGRHLAWRLGAAWGPPDVAEPGLAAWDLDRIRGARRALAAR